MFTFFLVHIEEKDRKKTTMLFKPFHTVIVASVLTAVRAVCPAAPTFVNPLTLQDGPTTFGNIANNKLSVAVRFSDAFAEQNRAECCTTSKPGS